MSISASIVLFHSNPSDYEAAIQSFLNGCNGDLYIIDNSYEPLRNDLFFHPRVHYLHVGKNLGFGSGHNKAISMIDNQSCLHLFLNPDVKFEAHVIGHLKDFMDSNIDVGALMPRINYSDGTLQRLCKLLPTPIDLIFRRFCPLPIINNFINQKYEMHWLPQDRPSEVPSLSGCFLLVRTSLLRRLGGFDKRFFMYMEDVDLVRRIGDISKTVYLPLVEVTHVYKKGSYRNMKLLKYHIVSAFLYFFKWGWFYDPVRRNRNFRMGQIR